MPQLKRFVVEHLSLLHWPDGLKIPSPRFRLFVAADVTAVDTSIIEQFARTALTRGMVYLCGGGPGCERFHDIVDDALLAEEIFGANKFAGPTTDDCRYDDLAPQ